MALKRCPDCQRWTSVIAFPALTRPAALGSTGETIVTEGEAACFYHPQKRAVVPCGFCGRFLCGLCDVELNGQHLCPSCLQSGARKGKLQALERRRVLYDDIACSLAVWPLLPFLWILTPATAPAALFMAIRYWKTPTSMVPRTKARFIVAIALSSLQILGWVALVSLMVSSFRNR